MSTVLLFCESAGRLKARVFHESLIGPLLKSEVLYVTGEKIMPIAMAQLLKTL